MWNSNSVNTVRFRLKCNFFYLPIIKKIFLMPLYATPPRIKIWSTPNRVTSRRHVNPMGNTYWTRHSVFRVNWTPDKHVHRQTDHTNCPLICILVDIVPTDSFAIFKLESPFNPEFLMRQLCRYTDRKVVLFMPHQYLYQLTKSIRYPFEVFTMWIRLMSLRVRNYIKHFESQWFH